MSCHGILPAAMRVAWGPAGDELPDAWQALAPALESAFVTGQNVRWEVDQLAHELVAATRLLAAPGVTRMHSRTVRTFAADVLAGGVRGYDQGVRSALVWLTPPRLARLASIAAGRTWTPQAGDRRTIRVVKEGHISSVLVVELRRPGGRNVRFVVNVARDASVASPEQTAVARQLSSFGGFGAAAVMEEGAATVPWFGRGLRINLLATTYSPGLEVHPLPPAVPRGPTRLLLVHAFDDSPGASVPTVRGRLLDPDVADAVWETLSISRTVAARFSGGRVVAAAVELSDGDVVADGKGRVSVVATDAEPWRSPASWWPYHVALASARNDRADASGHERAGRLKWNRPELAVRAVISGLQLSTPAAAAEVVPAAALLSDDELIQIAAVHARGDSEPSDVKHLHQVRSRLQDELVSVERSEPPHTPPWPPRT